MLTPAPKGIIFDMDGTLLDSMGIWVQIDDDFLYRHNRVPHDTLREDISTMTVLECATFFRTYYDLPMTEQEIMDEWQAMAAEQYRCHVPAKPGAVEFIRACAAKGVRMCVATATYRVFAEEALARLGISPYLSFIRTANEVGKGKNHPDIYLQCAKELQVDPSECWVFEDVYEAAVTAKSAGFPVCGIYDPHALVSWETLCSVVDHQAVQFTELLDSAGPGI